MFRDTLLRSVHGRRLVLVLMSCTAASLFAALPGIGEESPALDDCGLTCSGTWGTDVLGSAFLPSHTFDLEAGDGGPRALEYITLSDAVATVGWWGVDTTGAVDCDFESWLAPTPFWIRFHAGAAPPDGLPALDTVLFEARVFATGCATGIGLPGAVGWLKYWQANLPASFTQGPAWMSIQSDQQSLGTYCQLWLTTGTGGVADGYMAVFDSEGVRPFAGDLALCLFPAGGETGACCEGGGVCSVGTSADCAAAGGAFHPGAPCSRETCCGPSARGDANCDGDVNGFDIDPFVLALTDLAAWQTAHPGCDWACVADCGCDGQLNGFDIDPFVACLTGACPACEQR